MRPPAKRQRATGWRPTTRLALWAFETAHAPEAAAKLRTAWPLCPPAEHGLIEAMQGEAIPWPPHTAVQQEVQPGIWAETLRAAR